MYVVYVETDDDRFVFEKVYETWPMANQAMAEIIKDLAITPETTGVINDGYGWIETNGRVIADYEVKRLCSW